MPRENIWLNMAHSSSRAEEQAHIQITGVTGKLCQNLKINDAPDSLGRLSFCLETPSGVFQIKSNSKLHNLAEPDKSNCQNTRVFSCTSLIRWSDSLNDFFFLKFRSIGIHGSDLRSFCILWISWPTSLTINRFFRAMVPGKQSIHSPSGFIRILMYVYVTVYVGVREPTPATLRDPRLVLNGR